MLIKYLWKLIGEKSKMIDTLTEMLPSDYLNPTANYPKSEEPNEYEHLYKMLVKMIAAERDHVEALKLIYDSCIKEKPDTRLTNMTKEAIDKYNDDKKLIK